MRSHVIVVGGGPAGASAAYWLGEAGSQVLVLEKEALPRYKPCGGGVPQSVFRRFPFGFSDVIETWVRRVRFRFRDGPEVATPFPERTAAMVMRDRFDLHLLNHARADVRDRSEVTALQQHESGITVTTAAGDTFHADYLIGADGANSAVARSVGLPRRRWMGTAIEAEVAASDSLMEKYAETAQFVLGRPPQGYLWIFPKADHLSVGIGALRARVPEMRSILEREMEASGIKLDGVRLRGHPLPICLRPGPFRRGRVLLVGDAAGLVDPLLGEGIRHAVDSGRLAAESILAGHLSGYPRSVKHHISSDLVWAQGWALAFYGFPRISFELGVRNPRFVKEMLRLFAGKTSYRRMLLRALPNALLGLRQRLPAI